MNKAPRLHLIKTSLENAIEGQREYVIFDTKHYLNNPKFVQFSLDYDNNAIVLDVPLIELSEPELVRAERVLKKETSDIPEEENNSFQETYSFDKVDEASGIVEDIFRLVFLLPIDYDIVVEYI